MLHKPVLEIEKPLVAPEEYKSGFSFFTEEGQDYIALLAAEELADFTKAFPRDLGKFAHELWRTGRMEVLYQFFNLPDEYRSSEMREDDVVFDVALMIGKGNVSPEECNAFVVSLCKTSQNVHDDQAFGDEPFDQEFIKARVERIMLAVTNLIPQLPE